MQNNADISIIMSVLLRSVSCVYESEMRVNIISVSSGLPDQYCMLLILVQIIATSNIEDSDNIFCVNANNQQIWE